MNYLFRMLALITVFLFPLQVYANFGLASDYYRKKDFEHAFKEFSEAAKFGDHDAQNNLGVMYYRGEFVAQDKSMAYAWMAVAAQSESYNNKGLHQKIFSALSSEEQIAAKEKYSILIKEYSDEEIAKRLMPRLTLNNRLQNFRPLVQPRPEITDKMAKERKAGYVDVVVTIDKRGITKDYVVIYASTSEFSKSALAAFKKSRYEPLKIDGKAVDVAGITFRQRFLISGAKFDEKEIESYANELKEKAINGNSRDKLEYGFFLEFLPIYSMSKKILDNPNDWYLKSANEGNPSASYYLGRNILNGNMCTTDVVQSMGWLLKSANAGLSEAQYMLAVELFNGARFEKNEDKAIYWLTKASIDYIPAKLRYAWILSTHLNHDRRNGSLAADLILKIDDRYIDKQTLYQTRAAVAAENGNFDDAVKWQTKAIDDAESLELPLDYLQQKLVSYKALKPWREEI